MEEQTDSPPNTILLSDAHGNNAALQAVLNHAFENYKPYKIWYLGDAVGYGPDPFLVWQQLRTQPTEVWLAGNHEWGFFGRLEEPFEIIPGFNDGDEQGYPVGDFRKPAWEVLQLQKKQLNENRELMEHLKILPAMDSPRQGGFLTHGAFETEPELAIKFYIKNPFYSPSEIVSKFENARFQYPLLVQSTNSHQGSTARLFAFGHTHLPGIWRWSAASTMWERLSVKESHSTADLEREPLMLNPGSVGFPRDGSGLPSYVVIDWSRQYLKFERVPYDVTKIRRKMRHHPYSVLLEEKNFLTDPKDPDGE